MDLFDGGINKKAKVIEMRQQHADRISSLPEALIFCILSFLPTKYSVRTRLLSTTWKYFFSSVPVLDFEFDHDLFDEGAYAGKEERFVDFVNRVLMMYKAPQLVTFRLCAPVCDEVDSYFFTWILFAISRDVQDMDLCVLFVKPQLPRELFLSKVLSTLKLNGRFPLKVPSSANLPCLKILHLKNMELNNMGNKIFSVCPKLEELLLEACHFENNEVVNISIPTLRDLMIRICSISELVLNAPSLLNFGFYYCRTTTFSGKYVLNSLVKAFISPYPTGKDDIQLLNVFTNVQVLYMSVYFIRSMEDHTNRIPTFHKLTRLEVELEEESMEVLRELLNKSIYLEVLVLPDGIYEADYKEDIGDLRGYENVPLCVSEHLKEIEFRNFKMGITEFKLVEFFLANAKVLEKITLQAYSTLKEQSEFHEKLSSFSRLSRDCQIVIDYVAPPYSFSTSFSSSSTTDSDEE